MGYPSYDLTLNRLRQNNVDRCARWHPGGPNDWSMSDWAVAAAGECGEACNIVKKLNRERDKLTGNKETKQELEANLAAEIADTVIYLDLLAARAGIDLAAAIIAKFNLVSEREGFPERL